MGKCLKEVNQRAKERRLELERTPGNEAYLQFMDQVDRFLAQKDGFLTQDHKVSAAILQFLKYPAEEVMQMLMMLIFEQIEGGQYTYVDPDWLEENGAPTEGESPEEEEPSEEVPEESIPEEQYQYYQCKTGEIFRVNRGRDFHLLQNGEWVYCPILMSYFYDAASDYWEVNYDWVRTFLKEEKPQRKCPRCGTEAGEDHLFCMKCGADLKESYCACCGRQLPQGAVFCPYCGKRQ